MEEEPQTATVLQFAPKRDYVWQHRCHVQGQQFFLHRDGSVECAECHEFVSALCWGERGKTP